MALGPQLLGSSPVLCQWLLQLAAQASETHIAPRHRLELCMPPSIVQGRFGGRAVAIKLFHEREDGAEEAFQHELGMYEALGKSK